MPFLCAHASDKLMHKIIATIYHEIQMRRHIEGTNDFEPIIKWPGGKEKELQKIIDNCPTNFINFYEPFVGGGSVFMAIQANNYYINDFSTELVNLYRAIQNSDNCFFDFINGMESTWTNIEDFFDLHNCELKELYIQYRNDTISKEELYTKIDTFTTTYQKAIDALLVGIRLYTSSINQEIMRTLKDKMKRMKRIELEKGLLPEEDLGNNIETALKGAIYMYFRSIYNNHDIHKSWQLQTALFFFLRNFAYSGMFRFGPHGNFNVPYGGIAYNSKHLTHKRNYYCTEEVREHFQQTQIFNLDFEDFLRTNPPEENDFVFLDPPYDTEFSTYDRNEFGRADQRRLANYLINDCQGKWMLIIKRTDFIYNLYAGHPNINMLAFNKEYTVSFMNRNDKNVKHLLITNYQKPIN